MAAGDGGVNIHVSKGLCVFPIAFAIALPFWQSSFEYGWLEMATKWPFWIGTLAWVLLTIRGIRQHRQWWILITSPLVLGPAFLGGSLIAACVQGNCL